MTKLLGFHHPYCVYTFDNWILSVHQSWTCSCSLLKEYDKWRMGRETVK
jgi:hypothetical protein